MIDARLTRVAAVAALLAAFVVGCAWEDSPAGGSETSRRDESRETSRAGAAPGVDRVALEKLNAGLFDYFRVRETPQLAESDAVDLALVGEVSRYVPGRRRLGRVLVEVVPNDVFVGTHSSEEPVKVLLFGGRLSAALPVGSPIVLYMNQIRAPMVSGLVFIPVSPQGFITEDDQGSIFPMDPGLNTRDPLEAQVPAGVEVP